MNRRLLACWSRIALAVAGLFAATYAAAQPLPRVLILGDSVYQNLSRSVASELKGRAEIVHPSLPAGQPAISTAMLEHLDTLLGTGKWDLIHFNCGLADLTYRMPGMKSFRAFPNHAGGIRATSPALYESNLDALAKRLKATGAKIVWASTTPIRAAPAGLQDMGSEIEYNAIAAKVMATNEIPINDLFTHVKGRIDMTKPAAHGADPYHFDNQPIHQPVVQIIISQLRLGEPAEIPDRPARP